MTPLQQAAKAVIEQWDAPLWKNTISTAHFIGELRKALEAEQAQAVEPVGYFCSNPAGDFSYQVSLQAGYPDSVPHYTHPAPPPSGERAGLIAELKGSADLLQIGKVEDWDGLAAEILQAVAMLEADAHQRSKPHGHCTLSKELASFTSTQSTHGALICMVQAYGQACREAALEEAANVCESEYNNWDNEGPLRICATTIRSLK